MAANPMTTIEEVRNEFADIRHDCAVPLLEALVAVNNGWAVPDEVKARLQEIGERL